MMVPIDYEELLHETDSEGEEVWIPKSQLEETELEEYGGTLHIPKWLAREKGLRD